jgi:hypothetical protein
VEDADRKHLDQVSGLRREHEARLEEALRSSEADLEERLDATTRRVAQRNRQLQAELDFHIKAGLRGSACESNQIRVLDGSGEHGEDSLPLLRR